MSITPGAAQVQLFNNTAQGFNNTGPQVFTPLSVDPKNNQAMGSLFNPTQNKMNSIGGKKQSSFIPQL
jgi:hypothetical protein